MLIDLVLLQLTVELNCNKTFGVMMVENLITLRYMFGQNATVSLFAAHFAPEPDITTAAYTSD